MTRLHTLAKLFADGTPLTPKDLAEGRDAGIFSTHGQNNGWALTEFGANLIGRTRRSGDSASCPDEDSYWPPSRKLPKAEDQEALNRQVRRALDSCVIGPGTCNPTPPEASALDVQPGGDHYREMKIQPVQFIEANNIRFLEGCIIKRAARHDKKTGAGAKDLRKIIHEARLLLELRYGEKS